MSMYNDTPVRSTYQLQNETQDEQLESLDLELIGGTYHSHDAREQIMRILQNIQNYYALRAVSGKERFGEIDEEASLKATKINNYRRKLLHCLQEVEGSGNRLKVNVNVSVTELD